MRSCRVVGLLLLALLTTIDAGASREVDEKQLKENVGKWQQLQRMVNAELKTTQPDTFVNPFNDTGFLSLDKSDGSVVVLAAKNIVPDLSTMSLFLNTARNLSTDDLCAMYYPPPDGYERDAVPLITIAVMTNITYPQRTGKHDKYLPYLCALKRQTALMIVLDISGSLAFPPLGDICASMTLIRQALHSPRFLVTLFRESTTKRKSGLCRPIAWGNLSPFLQIRREEEDSSKETLVFLGSKGGSINFGVQEKIQWLGPDNSRKNLMLSPGQATERQRLLSHLYAIFDNTCQLAFRSRRLSENRMTGPRFAVPNVAHMKSRWQVKRKELSTYLQSIGEDFSTINMLMVAPLLLFAGALTLFIACNPQYYATNYEKIVEIVEEEPPERTTISKAEKKPGVMEMMKNIVSDPANVSKGQRVKKRKEKTDKTSKTVAELTAEADGTTATEVTAAALTGPERK
ncbi:hypothetical protein PRIPAC_87601 [Pristionchus pacificus]|uniref:Uncharacterized protein n=1 Tax=Pristionchus pacificus TaxID=54126 RepID=A0A2A6B727_PRIPA|nr:hypothetical protein PRIPAC_87601 [Pristionchus pacificus]|eukprot:PDM61690.1 hypothetical protein PRIPAC_51132 [Pristionchus pacificus]